MIRDITVIQVTDYWGVYVDGELAFEDNSPITVRDIVSLLEEGDDAIKLSFVDMDGTDLADQIDEDGEFPKDYPL